MNSPNPIKSIELLVSEFGNVAEFGGGTVLTTDDVARINDVGGTLIVSPNCEPEVITETKARGMQSFPGVLTPTECFTALKHGADGIKIFPATLLGTEGLKAIRAVLPAQTQVYMVGGVGPKNFAEWITAGANGFGLGSSLYKPGYSAAQVTQTARLSVTAFDKALASAV